MHGVTVKFVVGGWAGGGGVEEVGCMGCVLEEGDDWKVEGGADVWLWD